MSPSYRGTNEVVLGALQTACSADNVYAGIFGSRQGALRLIIEWTNRLFLSAPSWTDKLGS